MAKLRHIAMLVDDIETECKYVAPDGVNFDITLPEYARDFWKVEV